MGDISSLGYIRVKARNLDAWRTFALDIIGFAEGAGPEADALYLRMDERVGRIILLPGDEDRVEGVGWEVRDHLALARVQAALESAGFAPKPMSLAEAAARRVEAGLFVEAPGGTPLEFFFGPVLDHSPVVSKFGNRFVTGKLGLGHVVVPVTDHEAAFRFYTETLGFLPRGAFTLPGPDGADPIRMRFMGVNARHHSLALLPIADPGTALLHAMVEVETLDEVGGSLDRLMDAGVPLAYSLGRHTNDKMVSYYVHTPGGWDLEVGCEGMHVDENGYTAEEITADSYWGHRPSESR